MSDGAASYAFALSVRRELGVRCGFVQPRNDRERRQFLQGPIPTDQYDCTKAPVTLSKRARSDG